MNIGQLNSVQEIISQLKTADDNRAVRQAHHRAVKIAGTWGSFAPLLAIHLKEQLKKPILYISPHLDDADNVVDDLIGFGNKTIETLLGWAGEEFVDTADETASARARLVLKLFTNKGKGEYPDIISASIQSLMQPVPRPEKR